MVIEDISNKRNKKSESHVPPHIDRLFATVIDLLILTPLIGLFTSGIVSDLKLQSLNAQSGSNGSLIFQYLFVSFSLFVLYETLFNYFLRASPGHYFLYLRLVSDEGKDLSFLSLFFRSLFKFLSFVFIFIPFVEILLRPDRRTYYDRISFTRMITLKKINQNDDLSIYFKVWLSQWVRVFLLAGFTLVGLGFFFLTSIENQQPSEKHSVMTCSKKLEEYLIDYFQDKRNIKDKECILRITNHQFDKENETGLTYFARYALAENKNLRTDYLKKFCDIQKENVLCQESSNKSLSQVTDEDFVYYAYSLSKYIEDNDYLEAFLIVDGLYEKFTEKLDRTDHLEKIYMKSYLKIQENSDRKPAGENPKDFIDFVPFKKRMGILK